MFRRGRLVLHARGYTLHPTGFSLVEVLAGVVIIVALAAIAVPLFLNQQEKAEEGRFQSDLAAVGRIAMHAMTIDAPVTYSDGRISFEGDSGEPEQVVTVPGDVEADFPSGTVPAPGDCVTVTTSARSGTYCIPGSPSTPVTGAGSLNVEYENQSFTRGSNLTQLSPTIAGATGNASYLISGTLPEHVTFQPTTGVFTGPASHEWGSLSQVEDIDNGWFESWGVDAASDGSVFVTGQLFGDMRFGSHEVSSSNTWYGTWITAKLSPAGDWLWVTAVEPPEATSYAAPMSVHALPDGGAVVAGAVSSGQWWTNPPAINIAFGDTNFSVDGTVGVVARIDASGQWAWATPVSLADSYTFLQQIVGINDENIIVTGVSSPSVAAVALASGTVEWSVELPYNMHAAGITDEGNIVGVIRTPANMFVHITSGNLSTVSQPGRTIGTAVVALSPAGEWLWVSNGPNVQLPWKSDGSQVVSGNRLVVADGTTAAIIDATSGTTLSQHSTNIGSAQLERFNVSNDALYLFGATPPNAGGTLGAWVARYDLANIDAGPTWETTADMSAGASEIWAATVGQDGHLALGGPFDGTGIIQDVTVSTEPSGYFFARISPAGEWLMPLPAGFPANLTVTAIDETGATAHTNITLSID